MTRQYTQGPSSRRWSLRRRCRSRIRHVDRHGSVMLTEPRLRSIQPRFRHPRCQRRAKRRWQRGVGSSNYRVQRFCPGGLHSSSEIGGNSGLTCLTSSAFRNKPRGSLRRASRFRGGGLIFSLRKSRVLARGASTPMVMAIERCFLNGLNVFMGLPFSFLCCFGRIEGAEISLPASVPGYKAKSREVRAQTGAQRNFFESVFSRIGIFRRRIAVTAGGRHAIRFNSTGNVHILNAHDYLLSGRIF